MLQHRLVLLSTPLVRRVVRDSVFLLSTKKELTHMRTPRRRPCFSGLRIALVLVTDSIVTSQHMFACHGDFFSLAPYSSQLQLTAQHRDSITHHTVAFVQAFRSPTVSCSRSKHANSHNRKNTALKSKTFSPVLHRTIYSLTFRIVVGLR